MKLPEEENQADEKSKKPKPSPIYKHKKYLRTKFEEAMLREQRCYSVAASNSSMEPGTSSMELGTSTMGAGTSSMGPGTSSMELGTSSMELGTSSMGAGTSSMGPGTSSMGPGTSFKPDFSFLGENTVEKITTAAVQPPLPPSIPLPMIKDIKQDIEDDDNKFGSTDTLTEFNHNQELQPSTTSKPVKSENEPTVTMCRNFARGTCHLGLTCKFAHEIIVSQLPGVYTFCRNFQNTRCNYPNCKFVHATVFEKEHFYRTGFMPPHALAHLRNYSAMPPLPPPPPPPPLPCTAEVPVQLPKNYWTTPPPPLPMSCTPSVRSRSSVGSSPSRRQSNLFSPQPGTSRSSQDQVWKDSGASTSTRDCDSAGAQASKCNECPIRAQREAALDAELAEARRRLDDKLKAVAQISKQCDILNTIMSIYFKPKE